jgi:hypothetical protein
MKKVTWARIAILLLSLALAVAACGGSQEQAPPEAAAATASNAEPTIAPVEPSNTPLSLPSTDTPLPSPTDTPLPSPTDTPLPEPPQGPATPAGAGLDVPGLEQPANLDSFRSSLDISWQGIYTDGSQVSQAMAVDVEFVREPLAEHVSLSGDFPGMEDLGLAAGDTLEVYVVEGVMYMKLFGSWIQAPANLGGLNAEQMAFVATSDVLKGLNDASFEGQQQYNGVETNHYTFDESSFALEDLPSGMKIDEASGNLYVAVEGEYVLHMDVTMSGSNLELPTGEPGALLQNGTMNVAVDLSDINQPLSIQVPDEALSSGAPPEDIPLPDDAEELQVIGFMGMITFQSSKSPEEIARFYQAEMPNNGWTQVSAYETGGTLNQEYGKGERRASLVIKTDSDTGKTSVLITTEGGP